MSRETDVEALIFCAKQACPLSPAFVWFHTGRVATANGAVALLDNFPSQDATEVAQAKAYGAIILAHGNMAEWAFTNAISIGAGQLHIFDHSLE